MKTKEEIQEDMHALKEKIKAGKTDTIRPDDSQVIIAEMKLKALLQMSTDTNEIFSQVRPDEVFDISRAIVFSRNSLPSISERLKARGIEHVFALPVLETFIQENFRHLQKSDRKRVAEFLDGLKSITQTTNNYVDGNQKVPLMKRLV